jgi:hypothetical protein
MSYNGWTNQETWNIALWIGNDEGLYNCAKRFVARRGHLFGAYKAWVQDQGLEDRKTPDGVNYMSNDLDFAELDNMMLELVWG